MPNILEQQKADYRSAFISKLKNKTTEDQNKLLHKESRSLSIVTGNLGQYTVPQDWSSEMFSTMALTDPVRANATVVATDTGAVYNYPVADDVSNEGLILAENSFIGSSLDPAFANIPFGAWKYSSKLIVVPLELLQDSAYSLPAFLANTAGKRISRVQNRQFTVGTGSGMPLGIVNAASVGKVGASGQTASITYDDIVDLIYSVNAEYRRNSKFMFSDAVAKVLRKLKDSNNRPIWQTAVEPGQPDMLLGYPVVANDYVPVMSASAKSVLFGDFSKYLIRDVSAVAMTMLYERFAEYGQVGTFTFVRSDGNLFDANAIKYYQNSAT